MNERIAIIMRGLLSLQATRVSFKKDDASDDFGATWEALPELTREQWEQLARNTLDALKGALTRWG